MSNAKSNVSPPAAPAPVDARRAALLEAALGVFARFGYRKTSMDEVARAAQVSRQGLYLHFANKEELFRATLLAAIEDSLAGANRALASEAPLPDRLVGAFDEWIGRHVGRFAADAADLMEAAETVGGDVINEYEKRFIDVVVVTLRESGLVAAYKPSGVTGRQLAEMLTSVSRGLKHCCTSREEFREGISDAVRIICAIQAK